MHILFLHGYALCISVLKWFISLKMVWYIYISNAVFLPEEENTFSNNS